MLGQVDAAVSVALVGLDGVEGVGFEVGAGDAAEAAEFADKVGVLVEDS